MEEGYLGSIILFAGNFAPRNWAFCQGQLLAISQNQALFSLLGDTYGGDARTTFALPDLRGRAPVGTGDGGGVPNIRLGELGGQATTTLRQANLPSHTHDAMLRDGTLLASSASADSDDPEGRALATTDIKSREATITGDIYASNPDLQAKLAKGTVVGSVEVGIAGGDQPIDTRSPYLGMNYIICTQGLYPSRS